MKLSFIKNLAFVIILTLVAAFGVSGCDDAKDEQPAETVNIDGPPPTQVVIEPEPTPVVEVPTPTPEPEPAPPDEIATPTPEPGIIINEMTDNIDAAGVVKTDLGTGFDQVAPPTPEPEVVITGDIYVDGKIGNDADDGTAQNPFKTIKKAKDYLRANGIKGVVCIAPGTYYLGETLKFLKEDSGSNSKPNVYRGCQAEKPIIKGSKKIGGFVKLSNDSNIWRASLDGQIGTDVNFYQVFKNDNRLIRARHPNRDLSDIHGGGFFYVDKGTPGTSIEFKYKVADIDPSKWKNPAQNKIEVDIHPNFNWYKVIAPILSVDSIKNTIKISDAANNGLREMKEGNRYFVQNAYEFLDSDGEWYRDIETNILYIYDSNGIAGTDEITAPMIKDLFYVGGAGDLQFIGLQVGENDGTAFDIENSEAVLVQNCIVKNTKGIGIKLRDGNNYKISGNKIIEMGQNAIEAINSKIYRKILESTHYLITGNEISHTNQFYAGETYAVRLTGTVGAVVQYNKISKEPGVGIGFWGNNNVIEYNLVSDTGLEVNDMGAIYTYTVDWLQRGNIVRYNYVLNSGGYANANGAITFPDYSWGIYLDGYSTGTHVYGNTVYGGALSGIQANGGRDNLIEDNIILGPYHSHLVGFNGYKADNEDDKKNIKPACEGVLNLAANGYDKGKYDEAYPALKDIFDLCKEIVILYEKNDVEGLKQVKVTQGNKFLNNRIISPETNALLYWFYGRIDENKTTINNNSIWHGAKSIVVRSDDGSLLSWNGIKDKLGFDKNSVNISDSYKVQPFKIIGNAGYNLIKKSTFDSNSTFDDAKTGWWSGNWPNPTLSWVAQCSLGSGCLKVSNNGIDGSVHASDFEIKKGKIYNLQFNIVSASDDELEVQLRGSVQPLPNLGLQEVIIISKDPKKYDFTFAATESFEIAWLTFQSHRFDPLALYYLDNVVLKEVTAFANNPKDDYKALINTMMSRSKTFDLGGKDYCDLDGQPVSGSVTLKPMKSAVLLSCYCNNDLFCNNKETHATCPGDCP